MEKRNTPGFQEISRRADSLRRIYSRIGEPLPVDLIVDLYQFLPAALRLLAETPNPKKRPKS